MLPKSSDVNMKNVSHPLDLSEDQLAQFREAEALLEHADDMIQVPPLTPSISPPRERSSRSGSIQRKVSFRNEDVICHCGQHLRGRSVGYTNGYTMYNGYSSIERQAPHERGASVPMLLHHSQSSSIYPPVERAIVKTFSIDKMRPICPTCNPGGDTPYPPDFPPIPSREAIEEDSNAGRKTVSRYNRSLSPTVNGISEIGISDTKLLYGSNDKSCRNGTSSPYSDSAQNSTASTLLQNGNTSPKTVTTAKPDDSTEQIKGYSDAQSA